MEHLQKQVKLGLAKFEEIKETSEQLKLYDAECSRNATFEIEVVVTRAVEVDMSGTGTFNTNCQENVIGVNFNQRYRWEYKQFKEKQTFDDLKEKYLEASEAKRTLQEVIAQLKAGYQRHQAEVGEIMKRSVKSLNRLGDIALKPNPLSTPEYIDLLIEGEKAEAKPGWKQRVEYLMETGLDMYWLKQGDTSGTAGFESLAA
ncbi:hypothetical protein JOQ06_022891 [Pogonophryne albipinna]|uniref:Uncharacterized protein n=1 Tax=Pogonophryne albipinna TaxID=1090488 RepID=A0AAD6F362_9TELE|nr:hypothetical protein JOQ06_022891 [Pogonophryne albipinna]